MPYQAKNFSKAITKTRMHSSRMRTVRSSSHLLRVICLSAYWDQPPLGCGPGGSPLGVGLKTPLQQTPQHPPGCGLETIPWPDPSTSPLGVGLEIPFQPDPSTPLPWMWASRPPSSQTHQHPPWVWAWRPPRPDPSTSPWVWAWTSPPVNRMTDRQV